MDFPELIERLQRPGAFPHPADDLRVHRTHISVVLLAGEYAYKLKKPLDLGFLDFSTLEKRRRACEDEVRLNRRLAPDVYLGVVPVTAGPDGPRFGGDGELLEVAVRMRRLPPEATAASRLERDELRAEALVRIARRIARFHGEADSGPEISRFGRWDVVAGNARENFEQTAAHVGDVVAAPVHRRARRLTERSLHRLRPLIEARASRGVPRDTHGDLLLEHVYLFPDREPPGDVVIVDCIEFNDRFRYADPVADAAFPVMDLLVRGRRGLARRFADAYFEAAGDQEGRRLLDLYTSYRAAVRAKVKGIAARQADVPADERRTARRRARAHWLVALGTLAPPGRRPCLVLVGGLPGTGKSTLARGLAERAGFRVIASDRVRKTLAGLPVDADASAPFGEGLYDQSWHDRTYRACLEEADRALLRGERVLVDASFREDRRRRAFLRLARRRGVPVLWLLCRADPAEARRRLEERRGDASDAGPSIYREAARRWEEPGADVRRVLRDVRCEGGPEAAVDAALGHLREAGLAPPARA